MHKDTCPDKFARFSPRSSRPVIDNSMILPNSICSTFAILLAFSRYPSIASCVVIATGSDFLMSLVVCSRPLSLTLLCFHWCQESLVSFSFLGCVHCCWLSMTLTSLAVSSLDLDRVQWDPLSAPLLLILLTFLTLLLEHCQFCCCDHVHLLTLLKLQLLLRSRAWSPSSSSVSTRGIGQRR